jgi:hypothetical protein
MSGVASCAVRVLGCVGIVFALIGPAAAEGTGDAATPQRIGGDKSWDAYAYSDKGSKVCYLVGHPQASEPASVKRGRVDALVTDRPKEKSLDVVNFDVGYAFKAGANAELDIDGHKFPLFTDKDAAWTRDAATDKAVTEALAKGSHATLKGSTARGTAATDTYALDGFTAALDAIDKACAVKR